MLPQGFLDEIKAQLGEEFDEFLASIRCAPVQALRLNPARKGAFEACREYLDGKVPWEDAGYYIKPGARPGTALLHAAGAFYIQDASAMAAVSALDVKPGERVLDLCAAPGGKSGQIAARLKGEGVLVSNEYVKSRALVLKSNLERLGVTNAPVTNSPVESD